MDKDEKSLEEYKEAATAHRLQNTLLIGELTVFLGATAALLNIAFSAPLPTTLVRIVLALVGLVLSCAFFIIGKRAADFNHAYRDRAAKLEEELGFLLYSRRPRPRWSATYATYVLYITGILIWLALLVSIAIGKPIS
jgi:hypothetical protein